MPDDNMKVNSQQQDDTGIRESIIGSERVFDGRLVKVDSVTVKLPDGREKKREVIRHPGAVALIVVDDRDRVLLERQYRVAADDVITEIPAGKIDPGEDPDHAAVRELAEETGFRAGRVEYIFDCMTAVGYSDEVISFYRAYDLEMGERSLDDGEFLNTFWMDREEFYRQVMEGKISDSKTMIAALLLQCEDREDI
ncbi:MAG: NUDIX domain-containing protein [Coriobacteriales bacterium]|jgi:ADP-ribose pyrophosphatase